MAGFGSSPIRSFAISAQESESFRMTPSPSASSAWDAAVGSLQQVVDLAEGLALVLVSGPGTHAREGLKRLRAGLTEDPRATWHHVDRQGADLASTLADSGGPRLLLVDGLERLGDTARQDLTIRLNLLRDTLSTFPTVIILWVPRDFLESFRQLCPDLFHWRSLLLLLSAEDIPLPLEIVARRRLAQAVERYVAGLRPALSQERALESVLVETRVVDQIEGTELPFLEWAEGVQRGLLLGQPGSGKTTALQIFGRDLARRAADNATAPVPIFLSWRHLVRERRAEQPPTMTTLIPGEMAVGQLDQEKREVLASGRLCLLLDGLDEVPAPFRNTCLEWLRVQLSERPDWSCIVTSRCTRDCELSFSDWQTAHMRPWSAADVDAFLHRFFSGLEGRARELSSAIRRSPTLRVFGGSPLLLSVLAELSLRYGALPPSQFQLFEKAAQLHLVGWDRAKELGRLRSTVPPSRLHRNLAYLALRMLRVERREASIGELANTNLAFEDFLYLDERTGLFLRVAENKFSFSHLAWQEYFAASALSEDSPERVLAELRQHFDDPAWRSVIVMAAGDLTRNLGAEWLWQQFWPESTESSAREQIEDQMTLVLDIAAEAGVSDGYQEHQAVLKRFRENATASPDAG